MRSSGLNRMTDIKEIGTASLARHACDDLSLQYDALARLRRTVINAEIQDLRADAAARSSTLPRPAGQPGVGLPSLDSGPVVRLEKSHGGLAGLDRYVTIFAGGRNVTFAETEEKYSQLRPGGYLPD
jgi:hypothetical protein